MPERGFSKANLLRTCGDLLAVVMLALLLTLAPVSSSAINLTWIALFVLSGWVLISRRYRRHNTERSAVIQQALVVLVAMFLLSLLLMVAIKLHWREPVRDLSFEFNAWLAASVSLVFATCWSASAAHKKALGVGLFVASLLAFAQGYGYMFAGHPGPSNAVNWGAGMALIVCLPLAMTVSSDDAAPRIRWLAVLGVCAFSLAIFVAGRRGAFFAIVWCGLVGSFFFVHHVALTPWITRRLWALPGLALVVFLGVLLAKDPLAAPLDRVMAAASEMKALAGDGSQRSQVLRSSVGSRFHMLDLGLEAGAASPWMGAGAAGLARVVQRAEHDVQAPLFHLHNEYLQAWVAYGVAGLFASLCFPIGLVVAGFLLRRAAPAPALAMAGLGLVHFFNGLSNVNTFHNFYGTVFAVCVALPFLTFVQEAAPKQPQGG